MAPTVEEKRNCVVVCKGPSYRETSDGTAMSAWISTKVTRSRAEELIREITLSAQKHPGMCQHEHAIVEGT